MSEKPKQHRGPRGKNAPGRPFVLVNMAMTADAKIATTNRKVSSFGSKRDQEHLLALRATADAVMAGARTVDSHPINMGPGAPRFRRRRLRAGLAEYNLRVVVSRSGTVHPRARVFREKFSPVIVLTTMEAGEKRLAALRAKADDVRICGTKEIDFRQALRWLARKWKVRRLLCEGGGELNDALFRAGLVDELHLTICPFIFAGRGAPTIADGEGLEWLNRARAYQVTSIRRKGREIFLRFARPGPAGRPKTTEPGARGRTGR
jgi:5-amino-6-(5-phosphoribosylamino)uracil reductase